MYTRFRFIRRLITNAVAAPAAKVAFNHVRSLHCALRVASSAAALRLGGDVYERLWAPSISRPPLAFPRSEMVAKTSLAADTSLLCELRVEIPNANIGRAAGPFV